MLWAVVLLVTNLSIDTGYYEPPEPSAYLRLVCRHAAADLQDTACYLTGEGHGRQVGPRCWMRHSVAHSALMRVASRGQLRCVLVADSFCLRSLQGMVRVAGIGCNLS